VDDRRSVEELTTEIQKPVTWSGRRMRGLRPWAEEQALLTAVHHGEFLSNGFRNRDLQKTSVSGRSGIPARTPSPIRR